MINLYVYLYFLLVNWLFICWPIWLLGTLVPIFTNLHNISQSSSLCENFSDIVLHLSNMCHRIFFGKLKAFLFILFILSGIPLYHLPLSGLEIFPLFWSWLVIHFCFLQDFDTIINFYIYPLNPPGMYLLEWCSIIQVCFCCKWSHHFGLRWPCLVAHKVGKVIIIPRDTSLGLDATWMLSPISPSLCMLVSFFSL